eukprot:TRINITY_DN20472_c0_g1_i3.p2 TRINITY_DN20472_c0_g1~~TRINITY_DN20472_c0_g1_i3.p2  ORF type:complete len:187 (-),score=28.73 TRINITY_DN20472_c0_g1_i3:248-808(-)
MDCIAKTLAAEGPPGIFRGLGSTLVREIPGNVAWFGVYELVGSLFRNKDTGELPSSGCIFAGASAGVAYWTLPFPADTVKTRLQVMSGQRNPGFMEVLRSIVQTEGIRGLYRGWMVTALRAAPSNAAVFYTYELCLKVLTGPEPSEVRGHPQHDTQSAQVLVEMDRFVAQSGSPSQETMTQSTADT